MGHMSEAGLARPACATTHDNPGTHGAATPMMPHRNESSPGRRLRLHHVLVRRRRWSAELDALLGRWER